MKKQYIAVFAAVAVLTASVGTTQATVITPGTGTAVPVGIAGPIGGTTQGTITPGNYSFSGNVGTVASTVVSGGSFNSLGGYTFIYTVSVTSGDLATIALNGFDGLASVDVSFDTTGAFRAPDSISFTGGGVVNYTFLSTLTAGQTAKLYVNTSKSSFANSVAGLIDAGTGSVGILSSIPEPSTIVAGALLLLPFGASTLRILRKKI